MVVVSIMLNFASGLVFEKGVRFIYRANPRKKYYSMIQAKWRQISECRRFSGHLKR